MEKVSPWSCPISVSTISSFFPYLLVLFCTVWFVWVDFFRRCFVYFYPWFKHLIKTLTNKVFPLWIVPELFSNLGKTDQYFHWRSWFLFLCVERLCLELVLCFILSSIWLSKTIFRSLRFSVFSYFILSFWFWLYNWYSNLPVSFDDFFLIFWPLFVFWGLVYDVYSL